MFSIHSEEKAVLAAVRTRRVVQFLVAMYIHVLMVLILAIFSRNTFSVAIRNVFLPLIR